jgi:predicted carbohydrate-binding protein with CBM5 and CBM33 domain
MAAMTEDQLNAILNQQLAKFLGQVTTHIDRRVDDLQAEVTARLDRIDTSLDGLAKRLDTDDQERLAIAAQLDRQKGWSTQLADTTNTKELE